MECLENTQGGWVYRFHKGQGLFVFNQKFKPMYGLIPVVKMSYGRRTLEKFCSENVQKQSLMLKKDCQFDSIAPLLKKLVGDDQPSDTNLEKPDLFG